MAASGPSHFRNALAFCELLKFCSAKNCYDSIVWLVGWVAAAAVVDAAVMVPVE